MNIIVSLYDCFYVLNLLLTLILIRFVLKKIGNKYITIFLFVYMVYSLSFFYYFMTSGIDIHIYLYYISFIPIFIVNSCIKHPFYHFFYMIGFIMIYLLFKSINSILNGINWFLHQRF